MPTTSAPAPYRLRSITSSDRAGLTRFYTGLSPEGRAARFHGTAPTIPEAAATFFCGPDHQHREGIVAESLDENGEPAIVGHVCIEPIKSDVAEIAIAVSDDWQGHGVGRAMLARAVSWSQSHGIVRLVASVECGNSAMFALLRSMGCPISYGAFAGGTVDALVDVRRSHPLAA